MQRRLDKHVTLSHVHLTRLPAPLLLNQTELELQVRCSAVKLAHTGLPVADVLRHFAITQTVLGSIRHLMTKWAVLLIFQQLCIQPS